MSTVNTSKDEIRLNAFEKASQEIEPDWDGSLENENVIEFLRNAKQATVTFTQGRYIKKIKKLAEQFPDKVEICHETDGLIVAHIPVSAVRINISVGREMSDEQKEEARQRLSKYWGKKKTEDASEDDPD